MLYFDRIDVSEETDINKASGIYSYCCFLNKGFKFQPNVSYGWHDLLMISMNLSDIATLSIKSDVLLAELGKVRP